MHQSNHTPEQRGVDVYHEGKIFINIPSTYNTDDYDVLDHTTHKSYPLIGPHSFKDGEDVTGRYELGYQCKNDDDVFGECSEPNYYISLPSCRRIVAIAIELDEEEHNIVFEGSNRYCSCGHPECTRYQPLPSKGQEGEADGWKYDYKSLSQLTEKVNELEFGEGLGMEEVESVLLAINYKHPEQVANEVSNWLFLKTSLDIEKIVDCKLFLQKVLTTPAP